MAQDHKTCDLSFTNNTIYKDLRNAGDSIFHDIKISLKMGTSSELVHSLKQYSSLLRNFNGNEVVEPVFKGMFSYVFLLKDHDGMEVIVKRSHDGWLPVQVWNDFYIAVPRFVSHFLLSDYEICTKSLKRDIYDYEKVLRPYWGKNRKKISDSEFDPYFNWALELVESFDQNSILSEVYSPLFWKNIKKTKDHILLPYLKSYMTRIKDQKSLIPEEERYIFYDGITQSLQTVFIQAAMKGKHDVMPGKKMAFPFDLVSSGSIPKELPKRMIEHIIRTIACFSEQVLTYSDRKKVPDFRPFNPIKVYPPTPYELYFAETNNLVAYKDTHGLVNVSLVDTHLLLEPGGNIVYRLVENRYWLSLLANLRFWVKKALDLSV